MTNPHIYVNSMACFKKNGQGTLTSDEFMAGLTALSNDGGRSAAGAGYRDASGYGGERELCGDTDGAGCGCISGDCTDECIGGSPEFFNSLL